MPEILMPGSVEDYGGNQELQSSEMERAREQMAEALAAVGIDFAKYRTQTDKARGESLEKAGIELISYGQQAESTTAATQILPTEAVPAETVEVDPDLV